MDSIYIIYIINLLNLFYKNIKSILKLKYLVLFLFLVLQLT